MAWRLNEYLVRGEIDNRVRGRLTGWLWLAGRAEPVRLELEGNAWRDIAGHRLCFTNPAPKTPGSGELEGFAAVQSGVVGDITASRKVKVPDCSMEELRRFLAAREPFPWHWGNSLYLEWHSKRNGRVVIESASYQIELDPEAAWSLDEAGEQAQREANGRAMIAFMERLSAALEDGEVEFEDDAEAGRATEPGKAAEETRDAGAGLGAAGGSEAEDDEAPTSEAEARADAEQARMDLLIDRVQARLDRAAEAGAELDFAKVMEEERARLRRERGEAEPEEEALSPEEEAERADWIAAVSAAAEAGMKEESWDADAADAAGEAMDEEWHPLVERCNVLSRRLLDEPVANGWLDEADSAEHPLNEVVNGVMIASAKLAGALGMKDDAKEWPPGPLFAGAILNRLKKGRSHLRDALAGLDAADEHGLASAAWRDAVRAELRGILAEADMLIREVRAVLQAAEGHGQDDEGGRATGD